MTETEWVTSTDPAAMLRLATGRVSLCCGCVWCDNGDGTESMAAGQKCCPQCDNSRPGPGYRLISSDRKLRLWVAAMARGSRRSYDIANLWSDGKPYPDEPDTAVSDEVRVWANSICDNPGDVPLCQRAALLREIVGNPWRPLLMLRSEAVRHGDGKTYPIVSTWLTPTVVSLAKATYEEWLPDGTLDPFRLLLVAEALEEAGCDNVDVLRHLRGERLILDRHVRQMPSGPAHTMMPRWIRSDSPHVRGCHVLDLLLGKE